MDYLQRVLWHEGMFLTPNQFQQWDRVGDWNLRSTARFLQPQASGFASLAIDREGLSADTFALQSASGLLPDGTAFSMPEADALPQARTLTEAFTPQTERLPVFLALPGVRPGAPTSANPQRPSPVPLRYQRRLVALRDDVDGGGERDVPVAVRDWRLRLGGEDLDGLVALKVAEVVRAPSGGFALADDVLPPCLAIGASPLLMKLLRRVLDICCARSADLAAQRRQRTQGHVEFSVSESANYLLLHTLNGAVPALMHLLNQPGSHPERLFAELARLAGHLHTFAADGHAKDLPTYRHEDPGAAFAALEARLRALLETNITSRYTPFPLTRGPSGIHATRLSEAVVSGHRLYLSVASSAPAEKIVQQTAAKAKISSSSRVPLLIAQAISGIPITYLSVPPGEIPAQPGSSYFEVQRSGDEWDAVAETRSLAIFLPPDFTDLRMEFLAVKE